MLVAAIGGGVSWTFGVTGWVVLLDGGAVWVSGLVDMVSALLHGIRVTGGGVRPVSSSDDSGVLEPAPWGSDLTSVASHRETAEESTTGASLENYFKANYIVLTWDRRWTKEC